MKLCRFISSFSLVALVAGSAVAAADTVPAYIWLEGEKPASVMGVTKWDATGWGRKELLSGETWLQINVGEDKAATDIAAEGVVVRYTFDVTTPGAYQLWNRVGYEFVRSPFEWRVDGGAWSTVKPDDLTTDLQALETWNEVAWIKMGDAPNLSAGSHAIEIRLAKRTKADGKPDKVLYASDALCLTNGNFYPNSKYKPGEERNTPEDKQARDNVFVLSAGNASTPTSSGLRSTIKLAGLWEVCRADEQLPKTVAEPFTDVPEKPIWTAIPVPSDKNESRPDLLFAHRLWYRTRVNVPADMAGKAFTINFPQNNLNTTIVVNGELCGFNKNPHAPFTIDITKAIKPGQVNEIRVGIRDAWYAYTASPTNPMKQRKMFNIPLSFVGNGFQDLSYPVWHAWQSGILVAPTLTASGNVYAADVFVKPSVARKSLDVDVTLSGKATSGEILCEAIDAKTGAVAHTAKPQPFTVATSGKEQIVTVSSPWGDPTLWWPDAPHMYKLRTTIKVDGKAVDVTETPFGFREWGARGKDFLLNGVVWHGWADLPSGSTPEEWIKNYRKTGQRFARSFGYAQGGQKWLGLDYADALDLYDREGIVVRRSGIVDGEAIGYNAIENDPELKKLYNSETKVELQNNWRDQMVQQVKAERNHPSIQLWSIENEWLYINCINLYGGLMDEFERRAKDVMDAVATADPTRLSMVDGGGAGKDQLFPVHGDHYVYSGDPAKYPALAYEDNVDGGGRGRWKWDKKRPRYLGEDFFANGINPADYAFIGGEETFQGKAATRNSVGLIQRMLTEGYRWAEYGAYHFWLGGMDGPTQHAANAPIAAFCKEWDSTFPSGAKVVRSIGLFNDSFRETRPLTFNWTLTSGAKTLAKGTLTKTVAPGESAKFPVTVNIPLVPAGSRVETSWNLSVSVGGKTVYSDKKSWSVLGVPLAKRAGQVASTTAVTASPTILLYDPKSSVTKQLPNLGTTPKTVLSLASLPATAPKGTVLIVGRDALTPTESASSALAAWASPGRTVIVLEQKNPLRYQALPAPMESTNDQGNMAFADDLGHPVLHGLAQKDFFTWGNDQTVYRSAYKKPSTGGRSLIQCHNRLEDTALAELPAGKGLLLLSQLRIAETLPTNAVAQRLLANLVSYGSSYRQSFRPVAAAVGAGSPIAKALTATGVTFTPAKDALTVLKDGKTKLAVVEATPANLKSLVANKSTVDTFTKSGGYLVLSNLTPDGLADYNKLVGANHMIRPFRRERVTFPATKHPLTAGLTLGDVVMQSGQRINNFTSDTYLASDVFTYAVDYDEVASFAKLPEPSFWGNSDASNDHDPYNMVNGFYSADGWQYIFSIWAGSGDPKPIPFKFSVPQTLERLEWAGNAFYWPTTKVELIFDGKSPQSFKTEPNNETQLFPVKAPGPAKEVGLRIAGWEKRTPNAIVGVDNVRFFARRTPAFYKSVRPMLSVGTLMEYPRGAGGIVLSNILFKDTEENPENGVKKQRVLGTILRNLKAPFGGGKSVLAGAGLKYTPIDIGKQATQYRNETGWFGDKAFTFNGLPSGTQTFAGVQYKIYDFPTSPVPTAVMLKGDGIPGNLPEAVRGIRVNKKADALFFLHTARIDARRNNDERRDNKQLEMARYIVHYADGQSANVPIYSEIDIEDYKQEGEPRLIPGAQAAWTRAYPGTPFTAVAYQKQWNNPRPDVTITSVDLEYGKDRRGVPVLLALTVAEAK